MAENETKPIERRKALKLILGGGAALGASAFLPGNWIKPKVFSGVLPAHAQCSTSGTFYGHVYDADKKPLDKIYVRVWDEKVENILGEAQTNAQGYYSISGFHPGTYVIRAQDSGLPQTVTIGEGICTPINFYRGT